MTTTCEYCNSEFVNKTSLKNHQKTAKFCLNLQGKTNEEFKCEYCNKILTTKTRLITHLESCNSKKTVNLDYVKELEKKNTELETNIKNYQEQLNEKNQKIEKLESHIMKLSERPTTTNNNQRYSQIIQNLKPISNEDFQTLSEKLEVKHINNGPYGYIKFATENFQDKLLCSDINRKNLKTKKDNKIITDINGKEFTYQFFNSINDKRYILIEKQTENIKKPSDKEIAVNHYGNENVSISSFLKRKEESPFINKFISGLSSNVYIKNILDNPDINNNLDDVEYIILSE
jgi:hypothetical protein